MFEFLEIQQLRISLASLVALLVKKGVLTVEEFENAVKQTAEALQKER